MFHSHSSLRVTLIIPQGQFGIKEKLKELLEAEDFVLEGFTVVSMKVCAWKLIPNLSRGTLLWKSPGPAPSNLA
jgi:hypothetical protein